MLEPLQNRTVRETHRVAAWPREQFMKIWRWYGRAWLVLCLVLFGSVATAQEDPPGRVGRLADFSGTAWVFDQEEGDWTAALRNRPLTTGDRLSTARDGRADLRIGSTVLRLGPGSELEIERLDDERVAFQLLSGSAALRVRSRESAEETSIRTPEVRLQPLRAGHYRVDRIDDTTWAGAWRGELLVDEAESFPIAGGQRMELWRSRGQSGLQQRWSSLPDDALSAWVAGEDRQEERSAASRYVSPEMTGMEDLDRHGRWDRHPEYGALWVPFGVQVDWAPYRFGQWVWLRPWGWTWVDQKPWGFAPFHYGRWVHWRGHWAWAPGTYAARPVFAPALVGWIGGPSVGISISIGGGRSLPGRSWVPLAPHEHYTPHFHAAPRWVDRVNPPRHDRVPSPRPVPTGPVMYGNQGVPNGVTVVSSDVLRPRPPAAIGRPERRFDAPVRNPGTREGTPPALREPGGRPPVRIETPGAPVLPPGLRAEPGRDDRGRGDRDRDDRRQGPPQRVGPAPVQPVMPAAPARPAQPLPPPVAAPAAPAVGRVGPARAPSPGLRNSPPDEARDDGRRRPPESRQGPREREQIR